MFSANGKNVFFVLTGLSMQNVELYLVLDSDMSSYV